MDDFSKYNCMEESLHLINRNYISLSDGEISRNNYILQDVLQGIKENMRKIDPMFDALYREPYYGGSYYDKLKVACPDEYDLDLLLAFPDYSIEIIPSNKPGFVYAKLKERVFESYKRLCDSRTRYLDTVKVLSWIQGILQKVLNTYATYSYWNRAYSLPNNCGADLWAKISSSGPAFTLCITGTKNREAIKMDIDFVTCFYFNDSEWPQHGFRANPCSANGFFIVPKTPKSEEHVASRYWRLSFQKQERELINSKEKVKPALRLLKKMRITLNHPVDSYYLKTIVLWELARHPDYNYWQVKSLSFVFMEFLKKYRDHMRSGKIEYYWNKKNNLIGSYNSSTCKNIGNRLDYIIRDIDRNIARNPLIAAKYILTTEEYDQLYAQQLGAADGWWCILM